MNLPKITDIFFDLDHTLWDFDRNSAMAFATIFSKHDIRVGLSEFLEIYVPLNHSYWARYRKNEITKEELRFGRLHDTFLALKLSVSHQQINVLCDDYIFHLPDANHLFPQTLETLDYLFEKYNLHIITDGFEAVQHQKLRNSKIGHYFKTVTTSEEAGAKKPDPQIFEHAIKKANCQRNKSLMIGDNLHADVLGAINFGMHAIHFSKEKDYNGLCVDHHRCLVEIL